MTASLHTALIEVRRDDSERIAREWAERHAPKQRRRRVRRSAPALTTAGHPVTVRLAGATDMPALWRLSELDSRPLPAGALLMAEVDGQLQAAMGLSDGATIADPFARTADLVALLRERARQLHGAAGPRARWRLWRAGRGAWRSPAERAAYGRGAPHH